MDLTSLNKEELQTLIKKLRKLKNLRSALGKKGGIQFRNEENNTFSLIVEYFPSLNEDLAFEKAKIIYEKVFGLNVDRTQVIMKPNQKLSGGMRILKGDEMVDMSFLKIERALNK